MLEPCPMSELAALAEHGFGEGRKEGTLLPQLDKPTQMTQFLGSRYTAHARPT